jgi:hypothetical protein
MTKTTLPKATLGRAAFINGATLTGLRARDRALPRVAEASTLGLVSTTASRLPVALAYEFFD